METFGALLENSWARIADKVNANDLDEPLATQLRNKLSLDESDIYPKYCNWILASREEVAAVNHYLDVNEHYLGRFKWSDNSLSYTNSRVPREIAKGQAALLAAQVRYNLAARAALDKHGNTIKFVLSAMRQLEKGMTPRHGTASQSKQQ